VHTVEHADGDGTLARRQRTQLMQGAGDGEGAGWHSISVRCEPRRR